MLILWSNLIAIKHTSIQLNLIKMKKCEGFQLTTDHSKLLKNDKNLKNSFILKHTVDNKVSIELESRRCLLGDGLPR